MPSGKKDIYGTPSKSLYKAGTVKAARAAEFNRELLKKPMPKEGISRRPEKIKPAAPVKKPQVISTTVRMKPTPMGTRK